MKTERSNEILSLASEAGHILLENGADIHAVRDMLGHKDVSSMQVYSKLVEEYRAHPRA